MPEFNVDHIKLKAEKIIKEDKTNIDAARLIYLEELMDWSDFYTEAEKSDLIYNAIINLWIEFTLFEISLNQFKKAVEIYEKALADPIASTSVLIYKSYINFCIDRNKLSNAQKILIKSLCCGFDDVSNQTLWHIFLNLMHKVNKSNDLNIETLYSAVKNQLDHEQITKLASITNFYIINNINNTDNIIIKTENNDKDIDNIHIRSLTPDISIKLESKHEVIHDPIENNQYIQDDIQSITTKKILPNIELTTTTEVPPISLQDIAISSEDTISTQVIDDLDNIIGLTPKQIIKIYAIRPPMIFTSYQKEPMSLDSIQSLSEDLKKQLESFLSIDLNDLINYTLPNMRQDHIDYSSWMQIDQYLDLLESMWITQAMKERHFDSWISDLKKLHATNETALIQAFAHNESLCQTIEEKQIENKKQSIEISRFRNQCLVQQELLHALINKTLFALLIEQQVHLSSLGFPCFQDSFTDKLLSYIDNRKSIFSSLSSSNSNISFEFDTNISSQISIQRNLVCAFLSVRIHAVVLTQQAYIQTNNHLLSSSYNNNDNMIESYNNINDYQDDYYNIEAKKSRKRRRSIIQNNNNYSHSNISSYEQVCIPSFSNNQQHVLEYDNKYNNQNINYSIHPQIPSHQPLTNSRGFIGINY